MKQLTELDKYILKQEFPQLSLTEDPDIERYFEFRNANRMRDALHIYNSKLKQKYPDDTIRVALMMYYRKRDSRFKLLLTDSLAHLAAQTILRIKKTIVFFAETVAPLKNAKVYMIIQVCEKIITAISPDRFAAIGFSEKYARYAEKLQCRAQDMRQAADILRMYITDTIPSVQEFRAEQNRKDYETQRLSHSTVPALDFSKIVFTKEQITAITLPDAIVRTEDQVLAYTLKYWSRYNDSAFENILLLYSRKYRTTHYSIFQAVKIGRVRNWKDEEILHAVLANVTQGYYYSISGDLYLQHTWKQIKSKMITSGEHHKKTLLPPAKKTQKPVAASQKIKKKNIKKDAESKEMKRKPAAHTKSKLPETPVLSDNTHTSQNIPTSDNTVQHVHFNQAASDSHSFSIADMIKKTTGKKYGIYHDLFFKTIRLSIRAVLQHSATHKLSFFGTEQNEAETSIYTFLEKHYDDPYQQWNGSKEQAAVSAQGFRLDSLEPIIRHWAAHNF